MINSVTGQLEPRLIGVDISWEPVSAPTVASDLTITYFCWNCRAKTEVVLRSAPPVCCEESMTNASLLAPAS